MQADSVFKKNNYQQTKDYLPNNVTIVHQTLSAAHFNCKMLPRHAQIIILGKDYLS